jgi:hypothetical protein
MIVHKHQIAGLKNKSSTRKNMKPVPLTSYTPSAFARKQAHETKTVNFAKQGLH